MLSLLKKVGSFDESVVRLVALQMTRALNYLHEELKIIHRDVKLQNVLASIDSRQSLSEFLKNSSHITENNFEIKLADFGFAR